MPGNLDNDLFRNLLRSHPEKAINMLVKKYWNTLFIISRSFTHDPESARDIVQETFALVWEKHKALSKSHEKSLDNYLVQVIRYKSITHFRKNLRITDLRRTYVKAQPHIEPGMESEFIKHEIVDGIRSLIATFPLRERQCIEMKIDMDLTNSEIAEQLNVTPKAVERSITSAYKRLRKHANIYF